MWWMTWRAPVQYVVDDVASRLRVVPYPAAARSPWETTRCSAGRGKENEVAKMQTANCSAES